MITRAERLSEQYRHYQLIAVQARKRAFEIDPDFWDHWQTRTSISDAAHLWLAISSAAVALAVHGLKTDSNYFPHFSQVRGDA